MDDDVLIEVKCPKCEHVAPETLAHLTAHWNERFQCEQCGMEMSVDREELLEAMKASEPGNPTAITMHKAQ